MNALRTIEAELRQLGYASEAIIRDYCFADVLSARGEPRQVELAAFTQLPESYRSAAFGIVVDEREEALLEHRALGAPILFSIGQQDVGVWRVGAQGAPRLLERVELGALHELFQRNADRWAAASSASGEVARPGADRLPARFRGSRASPGDRA